MKLFPGLKVNGSGATLFGFSSVAIAWVLAHHDGTLTGLSDVVDA